jgi:uncharacterized membrane protein YdjX (TVP38/TMEM64 family)
MGHRRPRAVRARRCVLCRDLRADCGAEDARALGAWGYIAFILAYTALQPFGVPGTIFVVAAPLIWPWPIAFALSMVGTCASVVGFSFARFVAKDWVSAHIPERLRKYDASLERNAFQTVVVLRLLFWMPQVLHSFFGVSKVRSPSCASTPARLFVSAIRALISFRTSA